MRDPVGCPVCEEPTTGGAACVGCGFPYELSTEELRRELASEPPATHPRGPTRPDMDPLGSPNEATPGPEGPTDSLAAAVAHDIESKLVHIRELGGDAPDVTSEVCQAALMETDGRASEALEVLRSARARLDLQVESLFESRLALLQERAERLRQEGLRVRWTVPLESIRGEFAEQSSETGLSRLADLEHELARVESAWKGLEALKDQVDAVRSGAAALGLPVAEAERGLQEIQSALALSDTGTAELESLTHTATDCLLRLTDSIPPVLDAELAKVALLLDDFPEGDRASARARRLHAEASRHLNKGRLVDAMQRVRELRSELPMLERSRAARPSSEAPGVFAPRRAEPAPETEDQTLERLLRKARTLAARVRTLPADSELAYEAAGEIRRATELLKSRKLDEADATLSRLMRSLAAEIPPA